MEKISRRGGSDSGLGRLRPADRSIKQAILTTAMVTALAGAIATSCGRAVVTPYCPTGGGSAVGGEGGGGSGGMECPIQPDTPLSKEDPFCDTYSGPTQSLFCDTSADCKPPFTECLGMPSIWGVTGICSLPLANCPGFNDVNTQCYTNDAGDSININAFNDPLHCGKPCNPVPEGWSCVNGLPSLCADADALACYTLSNGKKPHCTVTTINNQSFLGQKSECFNGFSDWNNCGSLGNRCVVIDQTCKLGECESTP